MSFHLVILNISYIKLTLKNYQKNKTLFFLAEKEKDYK